MPWRVTPYPLTRASEPTPCLQCPALATHHVIAREHGSASGSDRVRTANLCPACLARVDAWATAGAPPADFATPTDEPQPEPPPRQHRYAIPVDARVSGCTYCGAAVYWIITPKGKRCPVDAYREHRGFSHFLTCPNLPATRPAP